jgi:hypothetical protein
LILSGGYILSAGGANHRPPPNEPPPPEPPLPPPLPEPQEKLVPFSFILWFEEEEENKDFGFWFEKNFSESEIKFPSLTFWNEKERREEKRKR